MPNDSRRAGDRTYVVVRYVRAVWPEPPADEVTPLGTVRASSFRGKGAARAAWPDEPAAGLRVRRASACRPAQLLAALAADGALSRPPAAGSPQPLTSSGSLAFLPRALVGLLGGLATGSHVNSAALRITADTSERQVP